MTRATSTPPLAPPTERQIDPRAVRVALAPALAHAGLPAMVVEPGPILADGGDATGPVVDGVPTRARLLAQGPARAILETETSPGGDARPAIVARLILEAPEAIVDGRGVTRREIVVDGWRIELELGSERHAALRDRARQGHEESARGGPTEVHAIIPGQIVSVSVAAGDDVVASQQLLVVEAMKMQNELRAPRDGVVTRVAVGPGDTIEVGDLLLVLE